MNRVGGEDMKYLFLVVSLVFLMGCGGSEPQVQPQSYPSWYLNPPGNDGAFLYGVGKGADINQAKAAALSFVSESLSITVSSEFKKSESSTRYDGGSSSFSSAVSSIKAQAKEMEFSEYKIINNQQMGSDILLLVQVSRQRLFNDQKTKLERYSKELKAEAKQISKAPVIQQASLYKARAKKQYTLKSLALLAQTINKDFNIDAYLQQAQEVAVAEHSAQDRLKVAITASKQMQVFVDVLKEALNKEGIKVSAKGANTHVYLNGSFQKDEVYGFKIAKANLAITCKQDGKSVASNSVIVSGKSRYDYDKAEQDAGNLLRLKIAKEGLFPLLGVK